MSEPPMEAASHDSGPAAADPGPVRRFEPMLGALVEVTPDHGLMVELDGPEGETLRRPALATVDVARGAVGKMVELRFVNGDLDHPVITNVAPVIDWRTLLQERWAALGRKVLGLDPGPRKLPELVTDLAIFVCVAAWFEKHGNITHAATLLYTSRRIVRQYINLWKEQNPLLVPTPLVKERTGLPRKARLRPRRRKAPVPAPAPAPADGSKP